MVLLDILVHCVFYMGGKLKERTMIVCDICRKDVSVIEQDRRVFGLLPVEVSQFSYNKAEHSFIDADESSGMAYFLHGSCLDRVVEIARRPVSDNVMRQQESK